MNEYVTMADRLSHRDDLRRAVARQKALRRQDLMNLCTGAAVLGALYFLVTALLP